MLLVGLPLASFIPSSANFIGLSWASVAEAPVIDSVARELMPQTLEEVIEYRAYLSGVDAKLARSIAFCESTYRHFNKKGGVLRGEYNQADVGIFQINEKFHLEQSQELNLDIYTPQGNIDYAIWLIKNEGTKHWYWSQRCWKQELA